MQFCTVAEVKLRVGEKARAKEPLRNGSPTVKIIEERHCQILPKQNITPPFPPIF